MAAETIPYRGLTIGVTLQGDEYAATIYRPDGTDALTCYAPTREGAMQDAKWNIDINLPGPEAKLETPKSSACFKICPKR